MFWGISRTSQENTCAWVSFLIKAANLLKKKLWHKCFLVYFAKFLRTPFLTEHRWWLLMGFHLRESWLKYDVEKARYIVMLDNTTSITSCIQRYLEIFIVLFRLEIFDCKGIFILLKTVKAKIDTCFVSLVQGTINFSSNVKKIWIECFLYFIHLILKSLFLTFWKIMFGKDSYTLVIWTIKLNIYTVFMQNHF